LTIPFARIEHDGRLPHSDYLLLKSNADSHGVVAAISRGIRFPLAALLAGLALAAVAAPAAVSATTFPATPILDNFNRVNGGLGSSWMALTDPRDGAPISIVSAHAQVGTGSNGWGSASWAARLGNDEEVYATAGNATEVWLAARASNPGTSSFSAYQLQWTTAGQLRFYRTSGTVNAQVGSTLSAAAPATGRKVGLRVQGPTLTAYVDSGSGFTAVGSATDSSIAGGSYVGIDMKRGGIFDDFGGGSLAAESASPPATSPPPSSPPACQGAAYICADPASFPKMSTYLSFNFDPTLLSRFALNVVRGCYPIAADRSFALNPHQVNLIVPGTSVATGTAPGPGCGSEPGFGVTYGSGYAKTTSTIASPYPGVGTIRPFQSSDYAHYTDGAVAGPNMLNLFSSGSSNTTAEWAARLRGHWFLSDLGGSMSKHPGIHGVYGDNFSWWQPYFPYTVSAGGAHLNGTGVAWDDGIVRNQQTLRSIIGTDALLGGNGAGWTCSGYSPYSGDIPGGNCIADVANWENAGGQIKSASGWDKWVPILDGWIKAGQAAGRAKYGMITLFGTCGWMNMGHQLTSVDLRLGLAMATIGGVDLWAVAQCAWSTTVVPGGQYSIPEMGYNQTYPQGWLGQPTADPQRVTLGQWKRTFTGGTVYANTTGSSWTVDGVTVPAADAVFVKR
jgi:hypothetical protein